jgi:mono/diheme cytochrome c family protein
MQSMLVRHARRTVWGGLCPSASLAGLLFLASAHPLTAQTAPRRTVWEGAYTEAQATRGAASFGQSCGGCHSLAAEGRAPLVGDIFWKGFSQKTVGEMIDFVTNNMPNGNPRSLSETTYADIVAFLLKSNGFPAGTTELARSAADNVQILPKDGSSELPANSLARVVGCLAKSGSDWVVTRATAPERAERAAGGDETRPLGNRTMTLKFVLSRLDAMVGSRVAVNGILIGADGVDGINVTGVTRVAPQCP